MTAMSANSPMDSASRHCAAWRARAAAPSSFKMVWCTTLIHCRRIRRIHGGMALAPGDNASSRQSMISKRGMAKERERCPALVRNGPQPPSFHRGFVHLFDVLPIDEMLPERLQVVRAAVAIVDIVRMLPDVAAKDGLAAVHQRVFAIGCLHNGNLAVLDCKPTPAGAELGDAGLDKVFFHLGERTDVGCELLFKLPRQLIAAAAFLHPLPEVNVIVVLAGIVEEALVDRKSTR